MYHLVSDIDSQVCDTFEMFLIIYWSIERVNSIKSIKIIMAEIAVIIRGSATSNEGDAYSLQFTASQRGLILNKFKIYNR